VASLSGRTNSGLTHDHAKLRDVIMSLQTHAFYSATGSECPNPGFLAFEPGMLSQESKIIELAAKSDLTIPSEAKASICARQTRPISGQP
jgi:hypothetical protein